VIRRHGAARCSSTGLATKLCIRHELTLLTTDVDFGHIAKHTSLHVWAP
jgi:hypothetical protein